MDRGHAAGCISRGGGLGFSGARIVWPLRRTPRNADFEPEMVGGPGFEPGPHGPELCDLSSRKARNDRFQVEFFNSASLSVQM